ncbi:MAG TPA: ABC transporter permease subunit [Acidimicrobiales bacterium]|nr:ABC transporter permease subunit [Acidimicrobiales bacterium]
MAQVIEAVPRGHYRLQHVVKSEIIKVLTLPSTAITLGLTVVADLLVTGLVTNAAVYHGGTGFDATQEALTGMIVAGLTAGVFGALLITAEYSSGTIRATLAATPKRPVLLVSKIGVTALTTVIFCEVLSFVSFFLGEAVLSGRAIPSANLGSPGAFRAIFMTGLFIALLALMAFGFGLICRSTAAAIAAFAGVVFVLPLVMHAISPGDVRYLPTNMLIDSVMSTVNQGAGPGGFGPLSPGIGLGLMAIYAAIAVAVGTALFVKRDA